jgi:hypothetical protein
VETDAIDFNKALLTPGRTVSFHTLSDPSSFSSPAQNLKGHVKLLRINDNNIYHNKLCLEGTDPVIFRYCLLPEEYNAWTLSIEFSDLKMRSEVKLKITEDQPINPVWGMGSFNGEDSGMF